MGQFLSVDPLATDFAAYSPYNYVLGNPISLIDPDGRAPTGGPVHPSINALRGELVKTWNYLFGTNFTTRSPRKKFRKYSIEVSIRGSAGMGVEADTPLGRASADIGSAFKEYTWNSSREGIQTRTGLERDLSIRLGPGKKRGGMGVVLGADQEIENYGTEDEVESGGFSAGIETTDKQVIGYSNEKQNSEPAVTTKSMGISMGSQAFLGVSVELNVILEQSYDPTLIE